MGLLLLACVFVFLSFVSSTGPSWIFQGLLIFLCDEILAAFSD